MFESAAAPAAGPVAWRVAPALTPYPYALARMEEHASAIAERGERERVWLLEHPPIYTAGTSARMTDLLAARFPVHTSGRGGELTYHGPGQRVVYAMLDLRVRGPDIRRYVATLEELVIRTLGRFDIHGERRAERIGVWVRRPDKGSGCEDKIAAIGVRVKRWVTMHGLAMNVDPDLSHFAGIVPCGVADRRYGITSLADLGQCVTMADVDVALRREFERLFGPTGDDAAD
ncbi:MAG: lipoyl(octanoyl) transferase LipB [Proteobacteria bacterium]|nr:lipoyl(octanoyl) transferase LipB [Pseudomonadota bacterium]